MTDAHEQLRTLVPGDGSAAVDLFHLLSEVFGAAGVWQMTGTYSSLYGRRLNPMDLIALQGDPPVAFMQCWKGVWPITITRREGWMGPMTMDEFGRKPRKKRGTNGDACGSHI